MLLVALLVVVVFAISTLAYLVSKTKDPVYGFGLFFAAFLFAIWLSLIAIHGEQHSLRSEVVGTEVLSETPYEFYKPGSLGLYDRQWYVLGRKSVIQDSIAPVFIDRVNRVDEVRELDTIEIPVLVEEQTTHRGSLLFVPWGENMKQVRTILYLPTDFDVFIYDPEEENNDTE